MKELDLRRLHRLVVGKKVENCIGFASEEVNTAELIHQSVCLPEDDVDERTSLAQWQGLLHQQSLGCFTTLGQGESFQGRRDPGIKVIGLATPVRSVQFGSFESGKWAKRSLWVGQGGG